MEPSPMTPEPDENRPSVVEGSFWMVVITLLLFFLPAINGLIGGLVGGYRVGGVKRALLAAILPAIVAAAGLWLLTIAMSRPILGLFAGMTLGLIIALSDLGIFLGAAIGGALGARGKTRIS